MVAVPLTAPVERDHQQVSGFHLFKDSRGSLFPQDRVAQWPAHPVQHRGAGEERRFGAGDPVQELRAQVITHIDVVTGKGEADVAVPAAGLDGQRGDIQPRWPAFGPLQEITKARLTGLDSCPLQQGARLQRSHRQVVSGHLKNPALSAQPRRRQRHDSTRRQPELPPTRQAQGEFRDRVQALPVRYRLGMVEQHSHRRLDRGHRRHELRDHSDLSARGGQRRENRRVDRPDPVQRNRKGTQQHDGIVVVFVAGQPRDTRSDPFSPLRHQRRLAVAGRGGHGNHWHPSSGQPLDQGSPDNDSRPDRRGMKFRLRYREAEPGCAQVITARHHVNGADDVPPHSSEGTPGSLKHQPVIAM